MGQRCEPDSPGPFRASGSLGAVGVPFGRERRTGSAPLGLCSKLYARWSTKQDGRAPSILHGHSCSICRASLASRGATEGCPRSEHHATASWPHRQESRVLKARQAWARIARAWRTAEAPCPPGPVPSQLLRPEGGSVNRQGAGSVWLEGAGRPEATPVGPAEGAPAPVRGEAVRYVAKPYGPPWRSALPTQPLTMTHCGVDAEDSAAGAGGGGDGQRVKMCAHGMSHG